MLAMPSWLGLFVLLGLLRDIEWRVACGEMLPVMAELVRTLEPLSEKHDKYLVEKGPSSRQDALVTWTIGIYCKKTFAENSLLSAQNFPLNYCIPSLHTCNSNSIIKRI